MASADSVVSGKYITTSPETVVLEVIVRAPAPSNVIITQVLPPGTEVVRVEPAYKKYNSATGRMRWLLRAVQPGVYTLRLVVKGPIGPGRVHAEIRCLDPQSGKMMTIRVP